MPVSDAELVARARAGDREAFGEVVGRYRDMVYGFGYHLTGDFEAARDLAQEVFLLAYARLDQLREPAKLAAWLRRIALNAHRNQVRRPSVPTVRLEESQEPVSRVGWPSEIEVAVREALARLREPDRLALTLHYIDGYSHAEIGDFLGVRAETVKTRLARARERLREEVMAMVDDTFEQRKLDDRFIAEIMEAAEATRYRADVGLVPWEDAERAYLAVLERMDDEPTARQNLGRMYTRWGRYEEALKYLTPEGEWWSALNYAFCMDALGRRQEALTVYRRLAEGDPDSPVTEWARLGLREPTWPRDLDISAEPGEVRIVPAAQWQATASRTVSLSRPELAIDNNRQTDWYTGNGQEPGQWFQLSLSCPVRLTRIVLDHHGERSIYTNNWPRGVEAVVTADGETWRPVEVSPAGIMRPATVRFRPAQLVAAIKFTQTASHYPESWGIFEVFVFGPVT